MTYYSDWRIDIPLWIICPTCGRMQSSRNNYCSNCGRKFVNIDYVYDSEDDELTRLQSENAELRRKLDELQNMLTACGFEVIEDYDKRKAIKGHGLIYMQEKTE